MDSGHREVDIVSPIFILGAPCSGAEHLRRALSRAPGTVVASAVDLVELAGADPVPPGRGDLLAPGDLGNEAAPRVRAWFQARIAEVAAQAEVPDDAVLRLLAGGARESLQIGLINEVFPDARFVFTTREPVEAMGRMLTLWGSGTAVTHPDLDGWSGPAWTLPLIPGWEELNRQPLEQIVSRQWIECARIGLDSLEGISSDRWCVSDFTQLRERPEEETQRLCRFLDLGWFNGISVSLRRSITEEGEPVPFEVPPETLAEAERVAARTADYVADTRPAPRTAGAPADEEPLRSVHTRAFPELLAATGGSLLVSTYQTGRLILIRSEGDGVNTHFRGMDRPMGIATSGERLVIGARTGVHEYRDMPVAAAKLEPEGSHDACFLPRLSLFTGDVAVHDVGIGADGEIWLVATKLSCLATLDGVHSLVPRWTPPFISEIAGGDRCHLNGMAMVDGLPRFVTLLGRSDESGGWRADKATGGLIMDVTTGEAVLEGLSMPHSPRWHRGRLYYLESGHGRVCAVDPEDGRPEVITELPGFTRGLALNGRFAYVGLSQIRETATFGGLPIAEREPLESGVWVVDLEQRQIVGFVRFEGRVQEIFDVAIIPGKKFPEIAERDSTAALNSFHLPD